MSRGRIALRALGVLVVLTMYWWVPRALRPMSFFHVRRVEVVGARYLEPDAIVQALGLAPGASVFDNLAVLQRRLEAVSGISAAVVSKRLPATLRVAVTEVEPVALVEGPDGLVPLSREARALPYDVVAAPVDVPVVSSVNRALLEALRQVQITDPGLYADVAAARASGGAIVLEMTHGRVRMDMPVDAEVVRAVSSVRRYLAEHDVAWRELDGRFGEWVVVRKDQACGRADLPACRTSAPSARTTPPVRRGAERPPARGPGRRAAADAPTRAPARWYAGLSEAA